MPCKPFTCCSAFILKELLDVNVAISNIYQFSLFSYTAIITVKFKKYCIYRTIKFEKKFYILNIVINPRSTAICMLNRGGVDMLFEKYTDCPYDMKTLL